MEFINGVKVLNIVNTWNGMQTFSFLLCLFMVIAGILLCLEAFLNSCKNYSKKTKIISVLIVVCGIILGVFHGLSCHYHPYYEYDVKLSKDVDMDEFTQTYKIISQNGEIVRITDKNAPLF